MAPAWAFGHMGNLQDLMQFIFAGLTGGAIYALVARRGLYVQRL